MKGIQFTTIENTVVTIIAEHFVSIEKQNITDNLKNYYIHSVSKRYEIDEQSYNNFIQSLAKGEVWTSSTIS